MGNTKGLRRGTRYMFQRAFRKRGAIGLTTYLTPYKVGDIVDIKVRNPSPLPLYSLPKAFPFLPPGKTHWAGTQEFGGSKTATDTDNPLRTL